MIIPAYNEEANIEKTVLKVQNIKIKNILLDYIVINDGSTDKTKEILENKKINHICLVNNLGIGGAVQTGYRYALKNHYDIAIQFDGDGQHDENYIEALIEPIIKENYDFVIGSRFVGTASEFQSTRSRRIGIKFLSFLIFLFTRKKIKDVTSGFRACNVKIIREFALDYPSDYPEPETIVMLIKKGYKLKEVSVKMLERAGGVSSIKALKSVFYMIKVSLAIIIASIGNGGKKYD